MKRSVLVLSLVLLVAATALVVRGAAAQADREQNRDLPAGKSALRVPSPVSLDIDYATATKVDPSMWRAEGQQQVIIRLKTPAVAEMGDTRSRAWASRRTEIIGEQQDFWRRCERIAPDARVLAQTQLVLNAVFVEVDAAALPEIAKDPAVSRIAPVGNYEMHLSETVPQIGAAAVQAAGLDGSGVRVAVLDSGIDYTHAKLGGAGTLAAYEAAYGTDTGPFGGDDRHTVLDAQFPNDKVVGGFDFVGEDWPFGPRAPDPDPIPPAISSVRAATAPTSPTSSEARTVWHRESISTR